MAGKRERLKVAIIGAGAIGLYLAWRLGQQGHLVVVYEKKLGIGAKACSGLVSERIYNFIPDIDSLVENKISSCNIHFPRRTIQLRFEHPHLCLSRRQLNEKLFYLAKKVGTSFVWISSFSRIIGSIDGFDRIIGCDGAYSEVRRWLKLPDPKMKLGIQAFSVEKDYNEYTDTWPVYPYTKNFGAGVNGGFFWRIPKGEFVEYGIMADSSFATKAFKMFTENFGVIGLQNIKAAPIPQGLVVPNHPKITLCGDAAGLTKPWSGGGLIWGFTAAEILLKYFPDFGQYRLEVKKYFAPKIIKGRIAVSLVNFLGSNFSYLLPSKITYDNDLLHFKN